ncbi:glycoside hydrolase family 76 protein [Lapillicoccus jejuensis]|uniref:Putative alpha-1,6-mannanase (GH76 family) n=1 Tax=Lapillicoccus jejuensis TaxID=402171 RepID=A0A542E0E8_9MICO|nr:glycoside hydrolase family 76 protein [Lapillicoccus jejuensis]TQJ08827.1 putative alpha-1,6-mannanase (GH76 family) [Lapillicoccus jejuensis]
MPHLIPHRPGGRALLSAVAVALAVALAGVGGAGTAHAGPPTGSEGVPVTRSDAQAAADVLMTSYDPVKAWFPSSWWNSAVALQTVGDYMQRTGDRRYLPELERTFTQDQGAFPAGYLSGDPLLGNFTSRAIDDTEWWGLTWLEAYDLTHEQKYLDMAVTIAEYVEGYWDDSTCGGGVWWDAERTYKNAVTNGLWVRLTAELHNRLPGDARWLDRATQAFDWYVGSGLVDAAGLVNDGLTTDCRNNGSTVWSYNQGLGIGGALEVYRATHDPAALAFARRLADAAQARPELVTDGVLTESCDPVGRSCDDNQKQFKGVFMRYWTDLVDTTGDATYAAFAQRQAVSVVTTDRDVVGRLGQRWAGAGTADSPNVRDWRTQASALSAVLSALPATGGARRSLSAALAPTSAVVMPSATASGRQDLTLTVVGTRPAATAVRLRPVAPDGWTVRVRQQVTLRPGGSTTQQSVPAVVTVPAGMPDGTYDVGVRAAAGALAWTATAQVVVARTADFDTGTAAEAPWLVDPDGSQSNGVGNRFADGTAHFTYRFPLPSDTRAATVVLTVDNEYAVDVSHDGVTWTSAARESQRVTDGSNRTDLRVDLAPVLPSSGADRTVYVRVSDAFPEDGWGGRVSHVALDLG